MPWTGVSRAEAARLAGMDRQALRDAVVRYNAECTVNLSTAGQSEGTADDVGAKFVGLVIEAD